MNTIKIKSAALAFTAAFGVTAATLLATAGSAHAAAPQASRSVLVRDLDLSTADGRRTLQYRVKRAATQICVDPAEQNLRVVVARRACIAKAIETAGPQIDLAVQRDLAAPRSASIAVDTQP